MVGNADLIQVDIDFVMAQNLRAEVHIVTLREDGMFLFSLKAQMSSNE